jgi:hypothetical protein
LGEAREKTDAEKEANMKRGQEKRKTDSVAKPTKEEKSDEEAGTWKNIQDYDSDSYVPTTRTRTTPDSGGSQLRSGRR